ncbi:probable E3 ubiquitin-protein ligase MARCHF10 isoform X2 [Talpa occidentalis]|uniref:probable E3 ubiquitin-protein ligase MARCHF10 isoform X2 n=1 Tax=Talpa occidentalis TaxID=50954 RepID=UPI00188F972B|nr:probable E3 ubiquitin-protein ligase MARCHF10 isoform X2 [Talpa occidentalis]
MLHEAKDRQKFVSDVQYLRDMQHKVDSEYQACLRRQECRKDSNEKKHDQFWGQENNHERSRFSSGSSSKQSCEEEEPEAEEPRSPTKISGAKSDSRLPAIEQTSVKQKHKSTMTPRKPEKAGPSKPSTATQAPQILSKKRRPNLGRLTVSPEMQSLRASGERGRQKLQQPAKAPALRRADPIAQQESPTWTSDTKPKRTTRERRNLVPSSQKTMVPDSTPERARKVDPSALSPSEAPPALSQVFLGANSPHSSSSESLGPPLMAAVGGPRRAPFRFRDEDFYSILSLNAGGEDNDTDEETQVEEELLLVGMHALHSPSSHKRSRVLGAPATLGKNKNFEGHPKNCRAHDVRSESSHSSLRTSQAPEPVPEQLPLGPRMAPEPALSCGVAAKENSSDDSEDEGKAFDSWDTKAKPRLDEPSAEGVPGDCSPLGSRPSPHNYQRDWQAYLNSSSSSLDYFLSGRLIPPRPPMSSPYNTPGSLIPAGLSNNFPVDLLAPPTSTHSSDAEGNSRFSVRRPLSPIRNRNPLARTDHHSHLPVDNVPEFDGRGAEDTTLRNQSQGAPLYTESLLVNPQSSSSLVESSSSSPPERMENLQDHLHVSGSLQENIRLTFFTVSNFPSHSDGGSRMAVSGSTDKEATKIKADPEKLKRLQESLLEEDSEEEGDSCRICQIAGGSPTNPLLEPCGCVGSLQFVHQECLKKWLKVKITSGADLGAIKTCEMCKQGLLVDLDDFNVTELYHKHQQSRAQNELMNSGLYLVLLLHLYEQRFAELMRLNYNRIRRERLSRNYPQPRPEENENSELGDENESRVDQSNSRVV